MTEIGMGVSNSYKGLRVQGHIGYPLTGVECALRDLDTNEIFWQTKHQGSENLHPSHKEGELLIKSHSMFTRYINKPQST